MKADDLNDVLVWLGVLGVGALLGYFGFGRKRRGSKVKSKSGRSDGSPT